MVCLAIFACLNNTFNPKSDENIISFQNFLSKYQIFYLHTPHLKPMKLVPDNYLETFPSVQGGRLVSWFSSWCKLWACGSTSCWPVIIISWKISYEIHLLASILLQYAPNIREVMSTNQLFVYHELTQEIRYAHQEMCHKSQASHWVI